MDPATLLLVRKLTAFLRLSALCRASMLPTMPPMRSKPTLACLAVSAAVVMLVPTVALSATKTVTARASSWGPARIEIKKGSRVKWENPSNQFRIHTVTAYGGNWSKRTRLSPGMSTTKRFRSRGTYKFRCEEHSVLVGRQCDGMCGVVRVVRR